MATSTTIQAARPQHRSPRLGDNAALNCIALDWANGQSITTGASSAKTTAFDANNDRLVMVSGNQNFWISVGPSASVVASVGAGSMFIPLNSPPVPVYVPAGDAIAAIEDSMAGTVSCVPALLTGN